MKSDFCQPISLLSSLVQFSELVRLSILICVGSELDALHGNCGRQFWLTRRTDSIWARGVVCTTPGLGIWYVNILASPLIDPTKFVVVNRDSYRIMVREAKYGASTFNCKSITEITEADFIKRLLADFLWRFSTI